MSLTPKSVLHRLLALALMLAPLVSTAMPIEQSVAPAAVATGAGHAHYGAHDASIPPTSESVPCGQHADCDSQCCAACAHCATAVPAPVDTGMRFRPVQAAIETYLHSTLVVSSPSRPPQAG